MKRNVETMLSYFAQMRKVYAAELNQRFAMDNFSPNEISILIILSNNPSIDTSSQIKVVTGVSKSLVSRSIDSLVGRGLITVEKDAEDKRIQRIHLTQASDPLVRKLKKAIRAINEEVLEGISEEEIRQMEQTMKKILDRFQERGRTIE